MNYCNRILLGLLFVAGLAMTQSCRKSDQLTSSDIQESNNSAFSKDQPALNNIVSGGIYRITSVRSGRVLDVVSGSYNDGAQIQQYHWHGGDNQRWKIVEVFTGIPIYKIISVQSNKALDIPGGSYADGTIIQQFTPHTGKNQEWLLFRQPNGSYEIRSNLTNKALDVVSASYDDGARIQQFTPHGGDNQQWELVQLN
ncbi:RICIN domain-containing protein [Chitinophaga nivalis]|uniref:RICIN domain-containing protein n=1 Tax=Chitinophaga nivalis TaxID=2991709 RepID=A0ABT3IMV3_9BACT|nr:RICIN domain-containing protein [Chitinophaga nivalis]MCW3465020.1 RICIN domain-containing protein [Chitinophaga nivalis]MCW3485288.1 RICIN domain-containing protein [Chitinophaga nivalis]